MNKILTHSIIFLFATALFVGCAKEKAPETMDGPKPVVISLLGTPYYEPQRSAVSQARLDSNLHVAKAKWEADKSEENYIWYGRRTAYLMHLDEAIAIYTEGIEKYPESYKLLRHRGHRYVTSRKLDEAIEDFQKAEQLMAGKPLEPEPDGIPNKLNVMLSTTQFNVFYHLALSQYLKGDFAAAEKSWLKCLSVCENDDSRIAVVDWLYMTLRREKKDEDAAKILATVKEPLTVIENDSYYTRLKMYQGLSTPEDVLQADSTASDYDLSLATQGYGVGNWYLYNNQKEKAFEVFRRVTAGKEFAAFGFIASEAELAR